MSQADTTPPAKMLTREQVTTAIAALMEKVSSQTAEAQERLVHDLFDLAAQIDKLYTELSSMQPRTIKEGQIQTAHDELTAVVEATQEATFCIIGEAEKLEKLAKDLPEAPSKAVTESVTRIYEACGFQDITGQRITKVVKTLKMIEDRLDVLINNLGVQVDDDHAADEAALLNGPALPGQAISQEEIDKLLGF